MMIVPRMLCMTSVMGVMAWRRVTRVTCVTFGPGPAMRRLLRCVRDSARSDHHARSTRRIRAEEPNARASQEGSGTKGGRA